MSKRVAAALVGLLITHTAMAADQPFSVTAKSMQLGTDGVLLARDAIVLILPGAAAKFSSRGVSWNATTGETAVAGAQITFKDATLFAEMLVMKQLPDGATEIRTDNLRVVRTAAP